MIGDAKVRGKAHSTTKDTTYVGKRPGRGGTKTIAPSTGKDDNVSGGDHDQHATAKRMTHGQKPGIGLSKDQKPMPAARRQSANAQGSIIDEWCAGKRSTYK